MSMSRWNPIYSYLLNLIMTCLETGKFELIMNTLTLSIPADYAASSYEVTLTFSK